MAKKESDVMVLKRSMKERGIDGLYVFFGEETFLRDVYIDRFRDTIPKDDFLEFNLIVMDAKTVSQDEISDAIESFPMMSEKKLVIIRDSGIFKKVKEEDAKFWDSELKNLPDFCTLLFVEDAVDKRSSLYKLANKVGMTVEFAYLKPYELTAWVGGEVLKRKCKMSKEVIEYFIGICQEGLANLNNELDKLMVYCDEEITMSDVKTVVAKSLSVQIFDLTDCIMAKNADKAIAIINDLKTVKESAFNIMYLLNSAFDKMLMSKLMLKEGEGRVNIEKRLGLPGFIADKYISGAKGFSQEFLIWAVERVPELDLAIKNGKISEWDALQEFLFDALNMSIM